MAVKQMSVRIQSGGGVEAGSGPPAMSDLLAVLQALGDPMRLSIVRCLAEGGERPCGSLGLPIAKATLTHHLHILRAAGLILQRDVGTRRMTRLDSEGMEQRFPGLLASVLAAPLPARCSTRS